MPSQILWEGAVYRGLDLPCRFTHAALQLDAQPSSLRMQLCRSAAGWKRSSKYDFIGSFSIPLGFLCTVVHTRRLQPCVRRTGLDAGGVKWQKGRRRCFMHSQGANLGQFDSRDGKLRDIMIMHYIYCIPLRW